MYTCMYICIYVYMYAEYVYMYDKCIMHEVNMHTYIHVYQHTCKHIYDICTVLHMGWLRLVGSLK